MERTRMAGEGGGVPGGAGTRSGGSTAGTSMNTKTTEHSIEVGVAVKGKAPLLRGLTVGQVACLPLDSRTMRAALGMRLWRKVEGRGGTGRTLAVEKRGVAGRGMEATIAGKNVTMMTGMC